MSIQVDEKLEDLYELVKKYCNLGPVSDLLREYRDNENIPQEQRDEIRITGDNRNVIITENLRNAVERGPIPEQRVLGLLQDGEENGNQHIFVFKLKDDASADMLRSSTKRDAVPLDLLNDHSAIAVGILGNEWHKSGLYPRLRLQPDGYCWADFRGMPDGGWLAKLYGHALEEIKTDEKPGKPEDGGFGVRWVKYELTHVRDVCVARWRPGGKILELRLPSGRAEMLLDVLTHELRGVIPVDEWFTPWNLSRIRQNLLQFNDTNGELYECGAWHTKDSESYGLSGTPRFQDPNSKVYVSPSTQAVVSSIAENIALEKTRLVVQWKPKDDNDRKSNLRTVLGTPENLHEIIIASKISAVTMDWLFRQLVHFDTQTSDQTNIESAKMLLRAAIEETLTPQNSA